MSLVQTVLGIALGALISALVLMRWLPYATTAQDLALVSTLKESALRFRTENCAALAPITLAVELEGAGVIAPGFSQGRFGFWIESSGPQSSALAIRQPPLAGVIDPDAEPDDPGPLLSALRARGASAHPALENTVLLPLSMRRPTAPDFEVTVLSETGGATLCG